MQQRIINFQIPCCQPCNYFTHLTRIRPCSKHPLLSFPELRSGDHFHCSCDLLGIPDGGNPGSYIAKIRHIYSSDCTNNCSIVVLAVLISSSPNLSSRSPEAASSSISRGCLAAIASRKAFSKSRIMFTGSSSKRPSLFTLSRAFWFLTGNGSYSACFISSTVRSPRFSCCCVAASRSLPNLAKASSSRYCAKSSFNVPDNFLIDFTCAEPPTLETEIPTSMAGRTPELKRSVSRKI